MTEIYELPLADTSDMVEMHRVFRNALAEAGTLVASAAERGKVPAVAGYFHNVLRLLHAHHAGEDTLLTPRLVERNPDEAGLIESVAAQHVDVLADLDAAEKYLAAWRDDPDEGSASALVAALATLDAALTEHLDAEEADILPIAGRCINVVEWGELPAHGLATFDGDDIWLVLGLIRAEMCAANLANMDAHLPPPVLQAWNESGEAHYRQLMSELGS